MFRPLTSIVVLVSLSACSGPTSADVCAGADSPCVALSLDSGRPVFDAAIGAAGVPLKLVFDTASGGFLISQTLQERMNFPEGDGILVGSPADGEPVKMNTARIDRLVIGSFTVEQAEALVMPPNVIRVPGADGLIGPQSLKTPLVEVDLEAHRLLFPAARKDTDTVWHPLDADGLPLGMLDIDGQTIEIHIDTGNPGGLLLPLELASTLPIKGELVQTGTIRTIDAEMPVYRGELEVPVTISGIGFTLSSVQFSGLPLANLGNDALEGMIVTVDTQAMEWSWSGRPQRAIEALTPFWTIGVQTSPRHGGGTEIRSVEPGSRAERSGLVAGDILLRMNGENAQGISPRRRLALLQTPGTILGIQRDGADLDIAISPE
ncbi:MAG TPA: aspartyl protease family protein [Hyphomonas sp.]|nr:aspartyl protease family protein [Hyphomonas sp.]